eukprot:RCo016001
MEDVGGPSSSPPDFDPKQLVMEGTPASAAQVLNWLLENRSDEDLQERLAEVFGPVVARRLSTTVSEVSNPVAALLPELHVPQPQCRMVSEAGVQTTASVEYSSPQVQFDTPDSALSHGLEVLLRQINESTSGGNPTFLARFEHLTYTAQVIPGGANAIPSVGTSFREMLMPFRRPKTVPRVVLNDLTGTLRPGKMTLVLGPPRSGKSAFMKVLSGQAIENSDAKVTGSLTCNGIDRTQVLRERVCGYISQRDEHHPTLTVRETIRFAQKCLYGLDQQRVPAEHREAHERLMKIWRIQTELILTVFGIAHVADTLVGNEMLRGISGGQKRRVTSAEMLSGMQPMLFGDE